MHGGTKSKEGGEEGGRQKEEGGRERGSGVEAVHFSGVFPLRLAPYAVGRSKHQHQC